MKAGSGEPEVSSNFKRFRSLMAVGAVMLFGGFVVFQLGRSNDTAVTLASVICTAGFGIFILAVLMRRFGPLRD